MHPVLAYCVRLKPKSQKTMEILTNLSSFNTFCDRRLAILELFLPIPMHFSRWGANLDAARLRLQFGHIHSSCFLAGKFPNTSTPGLSTIAVKKWIMIMTCYLGLHHTHNIMVYMKKSVAGLWITKTFLNGAYLCCSTLSPLNHAFQKRQI